MKSKASEKDPPKGEDLKNQILRKVTQLPAMPQTVMKARQIMSSDNSSFNELAEVLKTDQAIASKILKLPMHCAGIGMCPKVSMSPYATTTHRPCPGAIK